MAKLKNPGQIVVADFYQLVERKQNKYLDNDMRRLVHAERKVTRQIVADINDNYESCGKLYVIDEEKSKARDKQVAVDVKESIQRGIDNENKVVSTLEKAITNMTMSRDEHSQANSGIVDNAKESVENAEKATFEAEAGQEAAETAKAKAESEKEDAETATLEAEEKNIELQAEIESLKEAAKPKPDNKKAVDNKPEEKKKDEPKDQG